jgi:RHS repeat-associated protein
VSVRRRASGRAHYNYFRDYDPAVGRYVESDPIGLRAGVNTYTYVRSRPLTLVDPRGLVEWNGKIEAVGAAIFVGATLYRITVESECVNGKKGKAEIVAVGPTFGLEVKGGTPITAATSSITLTDKLNYVDPGVFNGWFSGWNIGLSLGLGFGCSAIHVGGDGHSGSSGLLAGAESWSCGPQYGIDASIGGTPGSSTVVDSSVTDCECEK